MTLMVITGRTTHLHVLKARDSINPAQLRCVG